MKWMNPKFTKLMLGGIRIPAGADSQIDVDIKLIDAASDIRRTVNGDAISVARAVFQRHKIEISSSDTFPAGLSNKAPGDYVECAPPERLSMSLDFMSTSVILPRAAFDVRGITPDGDIIDPIAQPTDPLPVQSALMPGRLQFLRTKPQVLFNEAVEVVSARHVFPCLLISWDQSDDERLAQTSWSVSLEEV